MPRFLHFRNRLSAPLLGLFAALLLSLTCVAPARDGGATAPRRDLAVDEAAGGHTLSRHVALDFAQLEGRLRREVNLAAASTFDHREAAEQTVGSALARDEQKIARWQTDRRRDRLVLEWRGSKRIGLVLERGGGRPLVATGARIVLARRGDHYFVLTAYPERPR